MIDIHNHCLHGIDDGPDSFEASVELCRAAYQDGIDTIIATPHVLRGSWVNDRPSDIHKAVERLNDALGGAPSVVSGCEYYFAHDAVEKIGLGVVPFLAGSRYVLLEFASNILPPNVEHVIHGLRLREWVPVIAHPERNSVLAEKSDLLLRLVQSGARLQVTSGSLLGRFGKRAELAAMEFLDRDIVHFVASDTHNLERRPPTMTAAYRKIESRWGKDRVEMLTCTNPAAVLADLPLPYDPEPRSLPRRSGFFSTLTKVFHHEP